MRGPVVVVLGTWAVLLCACLNCALKGQSVESTSPPGNAQQLWYTTHTSGHQGWTSLCPDIVLTAELSDVCVG